MIMFRYDFEAPRRTQILTSGVKITRENNQSGRCKTFLSSTVSTTSFSRQGQIIKVQHAVSMQYLLISCASSFLLPGACS